MGGSPIAWMIMLGSEQRPPHYPVYPGLPFGFYSHVEPVFGLYTNSEGEEWSDDDVLAHGTNGNVHPYYRKFGKLTDNLNFTGNCAKELYLGDPCVYEQYGFGWAMQGVLDDKPGLPLSLSVDAPLEPDTRSGQSPVMLHGTVHVTGLTVGANYTLYRWNSVESGE